MMKKWIYAIALSFILLSFQPYKIFACGNEYYTPEMPLQKGKLDLNMLLFSERDMALSYWSNNIGDNIYAHRDSLYNAIFNNKARKYKVRQKVSWAQIQTAIHNNTSYQLLSDFAWYELKLYNKANAVKLLEYLYSKHPGEYNIVANLGTAYEVTGNNKKALELLSKAVAIHPASHYGSEWIHIRILEQKLAEEPDYSKIINLQITDFNTWLTDKKYQYPQPADSLLKQIAYQLHERTSFIKPPDKIIGYLVFDFANIVAKEYGPWEAKIFYDYAVTYHSSLKNKGSIYAKDSTVSLNNDDDKVVSYSAANLTKFMLIPAAFASIAIFLWMIRRRKKLKTISAK